MFDTIKFKIKVSDLVWNWCCSSAITTKTSKREDGSTSFKFWSFPIKLPSWNRAVNVFSSDRSKNVLFVEFSIPKRIYGTNVVVPCRDELVNAVSLVCSDLSNYFSNLSFYKDYVKEETVFDLYYNVIKPEVLGKTLVDYSIPELKDWIVQKLDIGVMWNYQSEEEAQKVIDVLKPFGSSYFHTTVYKGHQCKFYLKHPEYLIHDYKAFVEKDEVREARIFADLCKGYLRFEVSLIAKNVAKYLGSCSWEDIINLPDSVFYNVLKLYLRKFVNGSEPMTMTEGEAFKILCKKYNYTEALKLISYLRVRDGNLSYGGSVLKMLPAYTKSKYNKQLREARIGVDAKSSVEFPTLESSYLVLPGIPA